MSDLKRAVADDLFQASLAAKGAMDRMQMVARRAPHLAEPAHLLVRMIRMTCDRLEQDRQRLIAEIEQEKWDGK